MGVTAAVLSTLLTFNIYLALGVFSFLVLRRLSFIIWPQDKHNGIPRPPVVPNWVPFLGHALSFSRGDTFWANIEKKYGPAVRLLVMGETQIFVTSTDLIHWVYRDSKAFDFSSIRMSMSTTVFDMSHSTSHAPVWRDRLFAAHHRAMQPDVLGEAIKKYTVNLEAELKDRLGRGEGDGKVVDLVEWAYDLIYTASSQALLGPTFPSAASKKPFIAFDMAFPLLTLTTLPAVAYRQAHKARAEILEIIEKWWATTTPEQKSLVSPAIYLEYEAKESEGWSERDWATILLAELWGLEANAPYAGIWTIAETLRRPGLLSELRTEIANTIATLSPPTITSLLSLPQAELGKVLPTINAAFQETLRFHTSTFSQRTVLKDSVIPTHLTGAHGGELSIKKGENIICITSKNHVSTESEWGDTAGVWDHTRFLKEGEGGKKRGSMMPFGGGVSMCEGRHFASAEILTFIAAFIHLADISIVSDSLEQNLQRVGLGLYQPKGKMKVRIAPR